MRCWRSHKNNVRQSLVGIVYGQDYDGIQSSSIPQLSFLINENILDKCFRSSSSVKNPRISPLTFAYEYPRLILLIITLMCKPTKQHQSPILLFHANIFKPIACFEHSNFFTVNDAGPASNKLMPETLSTRMAGDNTLHEQSSSVWSLLPEIQLRAFQLQQLQYTLLELELPRLLAPDLPSNGSSLRVLDCTHSNYKT
eukprot:TRINITY_DN433_c0_g1_i2.p1 TRINITY_DN433_c0_g1~~TRINITY_DN433_c0_g1_i2.p1  ORF type:complete len:198 (-),score=-10.24 TRINITY_DN433_c0_g1_i2:560-1153(-)